MASEIKDSDPGERGFHSVRMLLLPRNDPTLEIVQDVKASRAGLPSPRKWLDAVAAHTDLDDVRAKLVKVGLVDVGAARGQGDLHKQAAQNEVGAFDTLESIGGFAARFANEEILERARHELGSSIRFIPDVQSEGPPPRRRRVDPNEVPSRRSLWPPESGIAASHKDGVTGENVLVGVLDTGVDADHEVFRRIEIEFRYVSHAVVYYGEKPRDVRGFDVDGHGTHVCGLLAGDPIGVAPECVLHAAAVIESETLRTSLLRTTYGLDWMFRQFSTRANAHRQAVVNLSLGFDPGKMETEDREYLDVVLPRFIRALAAKDTVIVAAAGNGGAYGEPVSTPASFDEVLAVGAVDWNGRRASFSSESPASAKPEIYGYGVDVLSSYERDKSGRAIYRALDGTSMAAPYVAGIAALLRCANPRATAAQVREHMLQTARPGVDGVRIATFEHWPRA